LAGLLPGQDTGIALAAPLAHQRRVQPVGTQIRATVTLLHGRLVGGDVIKLLRRGERPPRGRTPRTRSGFAHASILAQRGHRRTGHDDGFLSRPTSNGGFALSHWPPPSLTRRVYARRPQTVSGCQHGRPTHVEELGLRGSHAPAVGTHRDTLVALTTGRPRHQRRPLQ